MQGICKNKDCNRLIFDTEKVAELPKLIECQHCHHMNNISFLLMSKEEKAKKRKDKKAKAKSKKELENEKG